MLFRHLKLNFDFKKSNFVYPDLSTADQSPLQYRPKDWVTDFKTDHWSIWKTLPSDLLSQEFLEWTKEFKIVPLHALLFYAPPKSRLVTHLDGGGPNAWGFNWAMGDQVKMSWYETIDPPLVERSYKDADLVKEIDSVFLQYPTIVKIGVPHGAENLSNEPRWLISLRFKSNLTFDNIADLLETKKGP
jgi:hypothetical protein